MHHGIQELLGVGCGRNNTMLQKHDAILTHMQHTTCKDRQPGDYLHEPTQTEDGVIEATVLQILLSAGLHLHERDFGVLVAVVDGKEHVPLNAHCLQHHKQHVCMHSMPVTVGLCTNQQSHVQETLWLSTHVGTSEATRSH